MADATLAFNILTKYRDTGASKAARDMDKLGSAGSRMGATLKKAAAVGAVALGAGAVLAAKSLVGMTKGAIDDEAAQKRLALALKNNAGATKGQISATESWISKQGVALGVTDDELRPALGRLVTATHSVGKAQKLAALGMNVSAGTGKSLKVVTEALMKAQNGSVAGLSKLGIRTKDAAGKTLTFTQVTKQMAETFKGQASKHAQTLEGKMGRLKLILDETKESIGYKLIPILTKFADWFLKKGLPAIQQFGDWAKVNLLPSLTSIGTIAQDKVVPAMVEVGKALLSVAGFIMRHKTAAVALLGTITALVAIERIHAAVLAVQAAGGLLSMLKATKLVTAATRTYAAVQWLLNAAMTANPLGLVIVAVAALGVAVVVAYKKSETFRKVVGAALNGVKAVAMTLFGWVKSHWPLLLVILTGPIGLAVVAIVKNFGTIKAGFGRVVDAAQAMGRGIGRAWGAIKNAAQSATRWVVDKVLWMAERTLDAAVSAFGWAPKIGDQLKKARDKVAGFRADVNKELGGIKDEQVKVNVKGYSIIGQAISLMGKAKGGPIEGGVPGKDSVLAALMPGEHVLTADEVRRAGGHRGIYAIRRMLKRGEFAQHGDVPAFAQGGPVFSASTPSTRGLTSTFEDYTTRQATILAKAAQKKIKAILKRMGGEGRLTPAQIARGQSFARSQVGDPYVWGGVGPNGYDCSGYIGAVLNAALGQNPYSRRGSTGTMPWAGFKPGKGSFSIGWFTGSPGHMAGSIGGMGIESAGGVGVRVGGAATPVSTFPHVAHFDKGTDYVPRDGLGYLHKGESISPRAATFTFTNCTFVGGSQAQFEDLLAKAYDNLKRKGRLN